MADQDIRDAARVASRAAAGQPPATLNYHGDTAAAMLAALMTCPSARRVDTLAVVMKVLIEHPERLDRDHLKEAISG